MAAPFTGPAQARAPQISRVADGIHVIIGRGGNIGVSVGGDGGFMIACRDMLNAARILYTALKK